MVVENKVDHQLVRTGAIGASSLSAVAAASAAGCSAMGPRLGDAPAEMAPAASSLPGSPSSPVHDPLHCLESLVVVEVVVGAQKGLQLASSSQSQPSHSASGSARIYRSLSVVLCWIPETVL